MEKEEALLKITSALTLVTDVEGKYIDEIGQIPDEFLERYGRKEDYRPPITATLHMAGIRLTEALRLMQCTNMDDYLLTMIDIVRADERRQGTEGQWTPWKE